MIDNIKVLSYFFEGDEKNEKTLNFVSSGLEVSKERFVGQSVCLSIGPYVEKMLNFLNEQNYAEFNSD